MADNKVLVEFQIVQKGQSISVVQKNTEKLAKSTDKASASQRKFNKQQDAGYSRQKQGMIQTANGTKNFSKLAQSIDGVGNSLVGAYATVAANVFALSALFNALKTAAKFEQLKEGLDTLGTASGRTLGIMAENLKAVTGNAISLEEAYRSAALGISGGFGAEELAGLAKIAKGAAQTLGRDLGDAFDRLTRGAIKLEPEILDELGIMVRLDDAVENYATVLGKAAGSLSQAERRQAFMNAILEQGAAKFGQIAEEVDTNVFDRLGATFGDLTKSIFGFVNAIISVPLGFLADNAILLGAALLGFGSTLAKQIVPGLANAGAAAQANAARLLQVAEASELAGDAQKAAFATQISGFKSGNKGLEKYRKRIIDGTASTQDFQKMQIKVNQSIAGYNSARTRGNNIDAVALKQRQTEAVLLKEIILLEQGRAAASIKTAQALAQANAATGAANAITLFTVGAQGMGAAFAGINASAGLFKEELMGIAKGALPKGTKEIGFFGKAAINGQVNAFKFSNSLRLIGAAALAALPYLAAFLAVVGVATIAYNKLYNTKEQKEFIKGQEQLTKILTSLDDKAEEYNKTFDSILPIADIQIKQFDIISNSIDEINGKLKEQIRLRKDADESRATPNILGQTAPQARNTVEDIITPRLQNIGASGQDAKFGGAIYEDPAAGALEGLLGSADLLAQDTLQGMQNILTPEAFEGMKSSVASIFQIEDSAELQSFRALMKSEIPGQASSMRNEFQEIKDKILAGMPVTLKDFEMAIDRSNKVTKNLNQNFRGVNQTLAESEKATSKFIKALAPKTSVDAISLQFQALETELTAASESATKAGLNPIIEIGRALSDTGTNVSRVVGVDFYNQLQLVKQAEKDINDTKAAGNKVSQKQLDTLDKQLNLLGGFQGAYSETLKLILEIQQAEITRKDNLQILSKLQSESTKITSSAAASAKMGFDIQTKTFSLKKAQLKSDRDMLENTFTGLKVQGTFGKRNLTLEEFKKKSLQEQLKLAKDNGIELNNVFALQKQGLKENNLELERSLAFADEKNQKEAMTQKALLSQLESQKTLNALTNTNLENEAKINKFKRTGSLDLNARETYDLQVAAARQAVTNATEEADIKNKIIDAELSVQKARLLILAEEAKSRGVTIDTTAINSAMDRAAELNKEINNAGVTAAENTLALTVAQGLKKGIDLAKEGNVFDGYRQALSSAMDSESSGGAAVTFLESLSLGETIVGSFAEQLKELGPEGEAISAMASGALKVAESMKILSDSATKPGEKIKAGLAMFTAIGQAQQAAAKSQAHAVDQQIEAEKKRDGKSADSVAKIAALEKKKEAIQRKAFEQNKKIQLAQAVVNGLSAIQSGFATQPFFPLGLAMGTMATMMTAMQIQAIKKQTFNGGGGDLPSTPSSALNIGKRSSNVDVAQNATGGELNYLRGGGTSGTNLGGAGGAMGRKGYANGGEGIVVGERGPEVITPASPVDITPNFALGGGTTNVNFSINAVDATGVEDLLVNQRGNIIRMIREAANENGEDFLTQVDPMAYGSNS